MFEKALPVWLKDKEKEKNIQAKFIANFRGNGNAVLKIAGATFYKVFLNGKLIHYGPSPTALGYARVDAIKLDCKNGNNELVIEGAGYNCFSYACVKQTSFIRAEVICDDECVAATGFDFEGYLVPSRIQKALRYSIQRHFSEVWDLSLKDEKETVCVQDLDLKFIERRADLPDMEVEKIGSAYAKDRFLKVDNSWPIPGLNGAVDKIGEKIDGFILDEIVKRPIKEFSDFEYKALKNEVKLPLGLSSGEYAFFECKNNTAGLINLKYEASDNCRAIIAFDEKLKDGKLDYKSWESFNVIEVNFGKEKEFTNFEVYGFKYFAVFVIEGDLEIDEANVIKVRNPIKNPPKLNCDDVKILKIYDAATETARCNTLGIFMDCPSRERAGWLCDSYFAAQALYALCGNTNVEDDFVENFVNAKCGDIPSGMLPQCYPADHPRGSYIPQWSLWFMLQLDQYTGRNKDAFIDGYKKMAYKLLDFFKRHENEYGLLENLSGWNFVEWSKANEWTSGINFPTNMLYSKVLKVVGSWFSDEELIRKSDNIKKALKDMSFDGKFFRDQAKRNEKNEIILSEHISEVCQYYAFMFDVADEENFGELKESLVTKFTPGSDNFSNIEKVNAFMGMYMRMELLQKWGFDEQLILEIKEFFGHMSDITGTLWEHKYMTNSLNHGFTAYIAALLLKIYNK